MADLFRADVLGELKTSNTIYYDEQFNQWSICIDNPGNEDDWFYCSRPDKYTGINDVNDRPIYENDMISCKNGMYEKYKVVFRDGTFEGQNGDFSKALRSVIAIKVIGKAY